MQEPTISQQDLDTWAKYLLDHSLGGISANDVVMIKGERICFPLVETLERLVIKAGGVPDVLLVPPNNERGRVFSANVGRFAPNGQLVRAPNWVRQRYQAMTKYIEVLGAEDPGSYAGLTTEQVRRLARADQPYAEIRLSKPWVLTLYPTPGFAKMEGLSLEDYAEFIVRASTTDPLPLKAAESKLEPLFDRGCQMTIETQHADGRLFALQMSLEHSIPMLSYGLRNFPDGEVFTSPDARSVEGEIYLDLPVHYGGSDIEGIYLRFEGGEIVDYSAKRGAQQLAAIIETDDGSHRLGEVALGMNPALDRVLKHPLFVEKVGGTLHVAIGASYETCFVKDPTSTAGKQRISELAEQRILNRSAQHIDIVADFRPGGCGRRVCIDDQELTVEDGIWVHR